MTYSGWSGTILHVDLTNRKIDKEPLDRGIAIKHIGALGLGTKMLYDEVGPEVDPLSPESVITLGSGPLVGTLAPCSGRLEVVGKSPLTGIFARSNAGGFWSSELKFAGYDLIALRGKSEKPVFLLIRDGHVELRNATHLYGRDTWETQKMLQADCGDHSIKVLSIGPAGENRSCAAAIINDLARAAATRGLAAILGSKNIKAIAVRGTKGVNIARPKEMLKLCWQLNQRFKKDPMYNVHTKYGTNWWVGNTVMQTVAKATGRPAPEGLMAEAFYRLYEKNLSCYGCQLHCSHFYDIKSGTYQGTKGEGVEGNTQLMGEYLQVHDASFICHFNTLCNKLGLDVMHTGIQIAWAMGLYQSGIISKDDTDAIDLTPGNKKAILEMVHRIASNEGFGKILGLGQVRAAKMLGRGTDMFVSHCKNYPSFGPGFMSSIKTTFAHNIATRGFDHLTGSPGIESPNRQPEMTNEILERLGTERYQDPKFFTDLTWTFKPKFAQRVYECENLFAISDMSGVCKFVAQEVLFTEGIGMADYSKLLTLATGVDFSEADLINAAEREMLLERAYNARQGIRRIDDYPHAFRWELEHGSPHPKYNPARYRMNLEDYDLMLDEYYRLRGCDKDTGIPTGSKLEALGLKYVDDNLKQEGLRTE